MKFVITLFIVFLLSSCGIDDTIDGNDGDNSGWEKEWVGSVFGLNALVIGNDDVIYLGGDAAVQSSWNYALTAFYPNGEKAFEIISDEHNGIVFSLSVDQDGNIYAGGMENSQGVLIKFGKDGNVIWKRPINDKDSNAAIYSIALDQSGNIFVADNSTKSTKGNITKFSSSGEELWNHNISINESEGEINSIVLDSQGNIYAGGYTWDDLFAENVGETDAFLVKIAPDGTHVWEKQWGGEKQDLVYEMTIDDSDNIYVAGGSFGEAVVLAKYSFDGNRIWGHTGKNLHYLSIVSDGENNIYCGSGGNSDLVTKYSYNGEIVWNTNDAGENNWGSTGIGLDSKGNLYVCGGKNEDHLIKIPASEMK